MATTTETPERRINRLYAKALAEGLQAFGPADRRQTPRSRQTWMVTSASDPGTLYAVGLLTGCSCPGYARHGCCKHYALVSERLGVLPDDDGGDERAPIAEPASEPDSWSTAGAAQRRDDRESLEQLERATGADDWVDLVTELNGLRRENAGLIGQIDQLERERDDLLDELDRLGMDLAAAR